MENNHNTPILCTLQEMQSSFDAIKETDGEGREWWNSRKLAQLLEENMLTLYKKAKPSPYFFKEDKESFPMAAEESPCLGE